jgi:hypothetical protein
MLWISGRDDFQCDILPGGLGQPHGLTVWLIRFHEVRIEPTVWFDRFPCVQPKASLTTDVVLNITRVLKGTPGGDRIVVSQAGGISGTRKECVFQYADTFMEPGERYILFLTAVDPRREPQLPSRSPMLRFDIFNSYAGLVKVEGDLVVYSPELRTRFDASATGSTQLIEEIQNALERPR